MIQRILGVPVSSSVKDFALLHIENLRKEKGSTRCAIEFRKFVNYYFGDFSGAKEFRKRLIKCDTAEELTELIRGV